MLRALTALSCLTSSLVLFACAAQQPPAGSPQAETGADGADQADAPADQADAPADPEVESPASTSPKIESRADRAEVWQQFVTDWNSGKPEALDRWSPAQGVLLLDNPGAFVRVRLFDGARALFAQEGGYDGARVQTLKFSKDLTEGSIPRTNCEHDEPLAPGTYLEDSDGARLATVIGAMGEYELAPPEEVARMKAAFEKSSGLTLLTVADTIQSVAFTFAVASQGPVLIAVDAVVPCSA